MFYLINGRIRLYCEKDGEELSTYFFTENMFAGSYDSFLSRRPSKVAIETLEECNVLVLSHEVEEKPYEVFSKNERVYTKSH